MDYSEIINLPHHVSKRHKPMSLHNRAAQFAPFAALVGYEDAIAESARVTDDEMELSADIASQLDQQLADLRLALETSPSTPVEVTLTFFVADKRKKGGRYDTATLAVKGIDENARRIFFSDGHSIAINNIVSLSVKQL